MRQQMLKNDRISGESQVYFLSDCPSRPNRSCIEVQTFAKRIFCPVMAQSRLRLPLGWAGAFSARYADFHLCPAFARPGADQFTRPGWVYFYGSTVAFSASQPASQRGHRSLES